MNRKSLSICKSMGEFISKLFRATCLEDLHFYVLNDSECHSESPCCSFGCETGPVEKGQEEIEIQGCASCSEVFAKVSEFRDMESHRATDAKSKEIRGCDDVRTICLP